MWQCFQSQEFLPWASLSFPKSGSRVDALKSRRTIRNTFVGITNEFTEIKLHSHMWQWDPISLLCNVHFWTGQAKDQSTNLYKRRGTLSCDGPWFFRKLFLSWHRRSHCNFNHCEEFMSSFFFYSSLQWLSMSFIYYTATWIPESVIRQKRMSDTDN